MFGAVSDVVCVAHFHMRINYMIFIFIATTVPPIFKLLLRPVLIKKIEYKCPFLGTKQWSVLFFVSQIFMLEKTDSQIRSQFTILAWQVTFVDGC